ncbi:MAG: LuxR C-terminal-related transcriptional regulator [Pseudomonadota bacterium]
MSVGRTDKEIALVPEISPRTVSTHLSRIYCKLAIRRRTQLVARYIADGGAQTI